MRTTSSTGILTSVALAMLASLLAMACSGPPAYQPIPLEQARALNSRVSAFYATTRELLEDSGTAVALAGTLPDDIRPETLNLQLVKNSLMGCFTDELVIPQVPTEPPRAVTAEPGDNELTALSRRPALGLVEPCQPDDLDALETYLDVLDESRRDFIIGRFLMVDELRVNLKFVLQERLNILEEQALDAEGEVVTLRNQASERYQQTMSSDEASREQQLQTEADYEVIQSELDDVDELLERIGEDLGEMRRLRRQYVEDVAVQLAAMGTPGS